MSDSVLALDSFILQICRLHFLLDKVKSEIIELNSYSSSMLFKNCCFTSAYCDHCYASSLVFYFLILNCSEARKSSNKPVAREVLDSLIYNNNPTYGGKAG